MASRVLTSSISFLVALAASTPLGATSTMSLCELMQRPAAYDHHEVSFRAAVESDGIEHTVAVDPLCQRKGVDLVLPNRMGGRDQIARLQDEIYDTGEIGTSHKGITAILSGTFFLHWKSDGRATLQVRAVRDLEVRRTH